MPYIVIPKDFKDFEIGALLVAVVAFPATEDAHRRMAAAEALAAEYVHWQMGDCPEEAEGIRAGWPRYAGMTAADIKRGKKTLARRQKDRGRAARMARGFFYEARTHEPAKLPEGMARHSLNELSKLVAPETNQSDTHNIEHRIWRASLPVIHLAMAMQIASQYCNVVLGLPMDEEAGYPIGEIECHRIVITEGRNNEQLVENDPRFGIDPEDLIRIRRA